MPITMVDFEEFLPDPLKLEIPLPGNPLQSIDSCLVKGRDTHLKTGTVLNREECLHAMETALDQLDIDLEKTEFFITHLHADHIGLLSRIASNKSLSFQHYEKSNIY